MALIALTSARCAVGKTLSSRAGEYGRCRHRGRLNHREPAGFECCIEKHESIWLNSAGGKSDG
jgi:hypothetical protein